MAVRSWARRRSAAPTGRPCFRARPCPVRLNFHRGRRLASTKRCAKDHEMGACDRCCDRARGGCGVAATDGHAGHARDGVRADRGACGTAGDRRGDGRPDGLGRQNARRGDPRGGAVRGRLPDQASGAQARVCGSAALAGDRPAADDRRWCGARGVDLRSAQCDRGDRAGDPAGADRCRPRRGGGDRAATARHVSARDSTSRAASTTASVYRCC